MNNRLKIFFFGTPEVAVPSLYALAELPTVEIVGVGVLPDRKVGRKQILTPCQVKVAAQTLFLPVVEIPNQTKLEMVFRNFDFDLGVVIAFGMLFPASILECPKQGVVNVHFSLLPAYRGASPVQQAILDGKSTSGITWQQMSERLDAGDILWQKVSSIKDQTTEQVWRSFSRITAEEFPSFLRELTDKKIVPKKQNEVQATFCRKLARSDGKVSPQIETAQQIYQKYLAFTPWPGIYIETKRGRLKILQCDLKITPKSEVLDCANNSKLHWNIVQLQGKKPLPIGEVLRGNPNLF